MSYTKKIYAFVGLFTSEEKDDPISVKSKTGLLLTFGDVPIFWSSKLESEIALSTLEVEYIALSQGMRELVAGRILLQELTTRIKFDMSNISMVCKVWEDNIGTQNLANSKGSDKGIDVLYREEDYW